MDKPGVEAGVLADRRISPWARSQAEQRGMRCVEGDFTIPEVADEIGQVDGILLFDVLLHTVSPDWDELLAMYADSPQCFLIANPQWERTEETVRLLDLGHERFLDAVPPQEP